MYNRKSLAGYLVNRHGIGISRSIDLCKELGFLPTRPSSKLSYQNLRQIDAKLDIIATPRQVMLNNIKAKVQLGTNQGIRRRLGRPVRGQRTHTNASTARKLNPSYTHGDVTQW